jgi:hypothetical protein
MLPDWLTTLAIASLLLAGLCSLIIVIDLLRGYRQHMWIMNIVWPITALYSGPIGLWAYFRVGRQQSHKAMRMHKETHMAPDRPYWQSVGLAATHCGCGCTLGDIVAEGLVLPFLAITLFGHRIFAAWAVDFVFAFAFGIIFQYFTIKPMRQLTPARGLVAALKADTLSLTAWQVGMYGWMAIVTFVIFGHELDSASPVFWFMMQIAMLAGFFTSYPVNWWLVRVGIKEKM